MTSTESITEAPFVGETEAISELSAHSVMADFDLNDNHLFDAATGEKICSCVNGEFSTQAIFDYLGY
jgi:hypothetical protein